MPATVPAVQPRSFSHLKIHYSMAVMKISIRSTCIPVALFIIAGGVLSSSGLHALRASAADRLVFAAKSESGSAKHVVLSSGDEEYGREESLPMLGKILRQKHGFKCTVLFARGPDGGEYIDSNNSRG